LIKLVFENKVEGEAYKSFEEMSTFHVELRKQYQEIEHLSFPAILTTAMVPFLFFSLFLFFLFFLFFSFFFLFLKKKQFSLQKKIC